MSGRSVGYDEIGSRTRQAWQRTTLGVIALTLLVERGLALAHASAWAMAIGLIPAAGFVGLAIARMTRIRHGESPGLQRSVALTLLAMLACIAVVGFVTVAG